MKNSLGRWETRDQVNVVKIWAAKEYVDLKRIGIWGWSYGGFMSSKVVEVDAGVHSLYGCRGEFRLRLLVLSLTF